MYKLSLFSFLLGIVTFWGCKEPDITPDNNKEFPISINVKANPSGGVEISWDKVNINKFENYTLIRSADSLDFSFQQSDTLWTIEDIEQTKIIDKNLPLIGKIFYRLSVNIKDRELQSKTVSYQRNDIFSFENLFYSSLLYNPIKSIIYLVNNNQNIQTINTETGILGKIVNSPFLSGVNFFSNTQDDPNNFYFVREDQIDIYDAQTLVLRQSIINTNYPNDRFASIIGGYGKYYVTIYNNPTKIKVFDATTKALLKTYNTNQSIGPQLSIRILPGQKRLIAMLQNSQSNQAIIIDLDDSGNIVSNSKVFDNASPFTSFSCSIAPNGETIIFNSKTIMDKDLKVIGTLPNNGFSGAFPLFSPNGAHLLISNGSSSSIIEMKDFQTIKTIPFKGGSSSSGFPVFLTNTEYVSFGEFFTPSGGRKVIITKTKFL